MPSLPPAARGTRRSSRRSRAGATRSLQAHGLGAYIAAATAAGDFHRIVLGIATMSLFVVAINRFFWRPLYYYAERALSPGCEDRAMNTSAHCWTSARCARLSASRTAASYLVLDGVNLAVAEGEIVGLLGRSGSGKSTLLRLIARACLTPSAGDAQFSRRSDRGPPRGVAMVFQSFAVFPVADGVRERGAGARGAACAAAMRFRQPLARGDRSDWARWVRVRVSA